MGFGVLLGKGKGNEGKERHCEGKKLVRGCISLLLACLLACFGLLLGSGNDFFFGVFTLWFFGFVFSFVFFLFLFLLGVILCCFDPAVVSQLYRLVAILI